MPDRVIRDELERSERYWALAAGPDGEATAQGDTLRLLFRHLLNRADDYGNAEAGPLALGSTMNRVVTAQLAEGWRQQLAAVDLVRPYKVGVKWYVHIPRFRQRLRALKGTHPRPPADIECNELKHLISANVSHPNDTRQTEDGQVPDTSQARVASRAPAESNRIESKGSESKGKESKDDHAASATPAGRTKARVNGHDPSRGTRMAPDAVMPDEWKQWAIEYGLDPRKAVSIFVEFRNYWSDRPGKDALKLRWFQTFQNRVFELRRRGEV